MAPRASSRTHVPLVRKADRTGLVTVKLFPLQSLIDLGAVELVVPGVLPIGCFPLYLTLYPSSDKDDYDEIGCLRSFNNLSSYHNELLKQAVSGLQSKHAGVRLMYADFYTQVADMVRSPENFGTCAVVVTSSLAPFHTCPDPINPCVCTCAQA